MDISDFRHKVTTAISDESPAGIKLEDDAEFDFIEQEMMKLGTLNHTDIKWDDVQKQCLNILASKSKDIRVLGFLQLCLQNHAGLDHYLISMRVWVDFVTHFWENCFPAPGNKGKRIRHKYAQLHLQRFEQALDKLNFDDLTESRHHKFTQTLEPWEQALEAIELSELDKVSTLLKSRLNQWKERKAVESEQSAKPVPKPMTTTSSRSSDKSLKQTLQELAQEVSQQETGTLLAISMRRYAVWHTITTAPDHDGNGVTALRFMSTERAQEYQERMASPDLELWQQVENSLLIAPYWFDGHYMSAHIALKLGHRDWADCIAREANAFLDRLPIINNLSFKSGEPFVPATVQQWLQSANAPSEGNSTSSGAGIQLPDTDDLELAMAELDKGLSSARELREQSYWRYQMAELMNKSNLSSLARLQSQDLAEKIKHVTVEEWEPSLIKKLQNLSTS